MLNTLRSNRGMVVSSHHLAAQAGLRVLRDGGNAIEAMVAAASTISVVYPHMNGMGGDGFWLISAPDARAPDARAPDARAPVSISGIGRAAAAIDPDWYRARGCAAIPSRGPLAANTVAGTVSGWRAALEVSARWGGRLPLARLLEDATHYAEHGVPVTAAHCANVAAKDAEMADVPGWHDLFMAGGQRPVPGAVLKQPALAETLRALAADGLDSFYRGDLARRIAADLERAGSPVSHADLEAHAPIVGDPIELTIGADRVFNTPPPTQGLASLAILGLYDRLDVAEAEGFDHLHGMVEAIKQAILMRQAHVTDPDHMTETPAALLADARLDALAAKIDRTRALPWPVEAIPGDTVWLGAIDGAGRAVSFIHSIFWEFGSGVVLRDTGIQWQNRGTSFELEPGASQELTPRRLPFHTNNPAMALLADGRVMVYGSMGGEGQPQTQAAVFSRYAQYGQDLQAAVTAPRWLLGRTWGEAVTELKIEDRVDPSVVEGLRAAGHKVSVIGSFDPLMGHAGAVVLRPDGVLEGAADPRGDGVVAAF